MCFGHIPSPLVIVNDFHIFGPGRSPSEADSPLFIDSDAVLPIAIALQRLEPIAGRAAQVSQIVGGIQYEQLAVCGSLQFWRKLLDRLTLPNLRGTGVGE
jgi:hypothetical protein